MMGISQWLLKRKFRKAISSMEKNLRELQEFYEFCEANSEVLSEDYEINFDKIKQSIERIVAGLAELDQMHAKYRA